jgi:hypothetical protein
VETHPEKSYGSSGSSKLPSADLSTARAEAEDELVELNELSGELPKVEPAPRRSQQAAALQTVTPKPRVAKPLVAPDASGLRRMLAEDPSALEAGLAVYCDAEGTPLGAGYTSGVGEIDLLAKDPDGELVVVMISDEQQGEALVAEVLQRIGWVRKHVAAGKNRVRGIVLCEHAPEGLSYTAAAVADTVRFKSYRIALSFEDLEI